MDLYRITFHTVGRNDQHFDAILEKATHYHVLCNNRKIGESETLINAIEKIIERVGENKEILELIDHIPYLQHPVGFYECIGITYGNQLGIKIEMKIRG